MGTLHTISIQQRRWRRRRRRRRKKERKAMATIRLSYSYKRSRAAILYVVTFRVAIPSGVPWWCNACNNYDIPVQGWFSPPAPSSPTPLFQPNRFASSFFVCFASRHALGPPRGRGAVVFALSTADRSRTLPTKPECFSLLRYPSTHSPWSSR